MMARIRRRPAPSWRAVLARLGVVAVVTGGLGVADAVGGAQILTAVMIAAVLAGLHVQLAAGSRSSRTPWVIGALATISALWLIQRSAVLQLRFWTTEIRDAGTWWPWTLILLAAMLFTTYLLLPLWPVSVGEFEQERQWVARNRSSLIWTFACTGVIAWRVLAAIYGSASADLIMAVVLVIVLRLGKRWRYFAPGLVLCVALLAFSAFSRSPAPSGITGRLAPDATTISFNIEPPVGQSLGAAKLLVDLLVDPPPPTLLGCRSAVTMTLLVVVPHAADTDNATDEEIDVLRHSRYDITVRGATRIIDTRQGSEGSSRILRSPYDAADVYTQWQAAGLEAGATRFDAFSFTLPVQHRRTMGSCYLAVPRIDTQTAVGFDARYFASPDTAEITLLPYDGTSIDSGNTHPLGGTDPDDPDAMRWTCFDKSAKVASSTTPLCPALAAITADWSDAYVQVTLLVTGALLAIATEQWLHAGPDDERAAIIHSSGGAAE
jgi:hypothetical protein